MQLPATENINAALIEIRVRPDRRCRGIATDFLRTLIPMARAEGRTRLHGSADSHGSGESWGAVLGYRPTLRYVQQTLILAEADRDLWSVPIPAGYRLEPWIDTAPESLLASYAVARQAKVMTQTADTNHMAAINRALGFQVLADSVYVEAEISDVEKALGSGS